MSNEPKKDDNLVDLAAARRKQRTVQKAAASAKGGVGPNGRRLNGASAGGGGKPMTTGRKIATGVQLIMFLGVLFYFMRLCKGPSL